MTIRPGGGKTKPKNVHVAEDQMKAFIAALAVIGIVSTIAAVTLENFAGSTESVNTSNAVRLD